MIGDHRGRSAARATLLVRAVDAILGTHTVVDPSRALVLWQVTAASKAIDPAGPWGADYMAWSWAFVLEPINASTTRLLTRMRVSYRPAAKWAAFANLLLEPAHFIMGRRQLLGVRQRAEATG
jgi:hypothetical protein